MKLKLVWIGKTRSAPLKEIMRDYTSRLERFARVEIIELRDQTGGKDSRRSVEREGEEILARIEGDPNLVALDQRGRMMDSFELSEFIEKHQISGTRQITFILGGPGGLSQSVRERADIVLSLSRMTFTHEMARILLVEQLYRAYTLLHNLPYQK